VLRLCYPAYGGQHPAVKFIRITNLAAMFMQRSNLELPCVGYINFNIRLGG
jgi:hypothetical protein